MIRLVTNFQVDVTLLSILVIVKEGCRRRVLITDILVMFDLCKTGEETRSCS